MKTNNIKLVAYSNTTYIEKSVSFLHKKIENLLSKKDKIFIALSGGSTPLPILKELSKKKINWDKICFYLVDDRCVNIKSSFSNYANLNEIFFKKIAKPVSPIFLENIGGEKSAEKYNRLLKNIKFDIVLLGMGLDGHTASLFPKTSALKENSKKAVYNIVEKEQYNRITLTYSCILESDNIIFLIRGDKKKILLNEILKNTNKIYPISKIIKEGKNVVWLIEE